MNFLKRIKDWWTFRSLNKDFDKEVDENVKLWYDSSLTSEVQTDQDVQQKYFNGLSLLKSKARKLNLTEDLDILPLAHSENQNKQDISDNLNRMFVYNGADVKTEADKTKMIEKRMQQYYKLQKNKEIRELTRKIRKLKKEGKDLEAQKLEELWRQLTKFA